MPQPQTAVSVAQREVPLLFTADNVNALRSLDKTQTRRLVTIAEDGGEEGRTTRALKGPLTEQQKADLLEAAPWQPGNRVWVRETWWDFGRWHHHRPPGAEEYSGATWQGLDPRLCIFVGGVPAMPIKPLYEADLMGEYEERFHDAVGERWGRESNNRRREQGALHWRKRPGIHLPRWAARVFADVVDVRIEPLVAISEHDAKAEGTWRRWVNFPDGWPPSNLVPEVGLEKYRACFAVAWNAIHADNKAALWTTRDPPWVYALTMRLVA